MSESEGLLAKISDKQFRRGESDARVGHPPAQLDGPYMNGYRNARRAIGKPMMVDADEYDRMRNELGDTCDRLVIEWNDICQEEKKRTEAALKECEALRIEIGLLKDPLTCCGCGERADFARWACRECSR